VLLCVYRHDDPTYFAEALDSLLAQTARSDDVVIAVDGPVGRDLADTISRYTAAHPEIRPCWLPQNVGVGRALQEVLPRCRHDIVLRMDADDVCVPDRAARQLAFLDAHPEVALLSATISEFVGTTDHVVTLRRVPATHAEIVEFARRWNPINQPAAVFRKQAALSVGGYQHFPRFEDYYLWVRMLAAGYRAANLPESLLYYRLSPQNLDRRRSWVATRSAVRFHLWKRRVGFANRCDTAYALMILIGAALAPGPVYRLIYRIARR